VLSLATDDAVILSRSSVYVLNWLTPHLPLSRTGSRSAVSLPLVVMLVAAVGAVAIIVATLPALDRFIRW
jgi:hypothetical protein